jgi:Flp pilus assembly protein TadD
MVPEAIAELNQARLLAPEKLTYLSNLTYVYAVSGQRGEAQRLFDQLQEMLRQRHDGSSALAAVYLGFGDKDKALELLDKSYEERSSALALLKAEPLWDSLRSDPRFQDLMRRVGLAQ